MLNLELSANNLFMKSSKYIVPIFAESTLIGTGVLHNSLLVTTAHVVDFCRYGGEFHFQYNSNAYTLGWQNKLFFEYDEIKMGVYRDLAIFETNLDVKGLSFVSEKPYDGETASIYGYYDNHAGDLLINQSSGIIRLKPFWDEELKICIALNKKSFLLMDVSATYECNSGCPLIFDDKVIGLVSQGNTDLHFCRLVSSSHITDVLTDINK